MDQKVFLPKLRDEGNKTELETSPGAWNSFKTSGDLSYIGEDIELAHEQMEHFKIESIPSVWAQPYLFGKMLFSDKPDQPHPARNSILNEWKGLLSAICFWDVLNLNIESSHVLVSSKAKQNKRLFQILHVLQFADPNSQFGDDVYTFKLNNKVIGAFSRFSLVFTPKEYKLSYSDGIPWITPSGRFDDPTKSEYKMSEGDKKRLLSWIDNTIERLRQNNIRNTMAIIQLLNEWKGSKEFSGIQPSNASFESIKEVPILQKIQIPIARDKVFTRKLGKFQNRLIPGCLVAGEDSFIYPVDLKYLNEKNATFESASIAKEKNEDNFAVEVKLKVQDQPMEFSKKYSASDIISYERTPLLDIWPAYKDPSWNQYFVLFRHIGIPKLQIDLVTQKTREEREANVFVYTTNIYPDQILLKDIADSTSMGFIRCDNKSQYEFKAGNQTYNVAIDFGTSFTNVFLREKEENKSYACHIKVGSMLPGSDKTDFLVRMQHFLCSPDSVAKANSGGYEFDVKFPISTALLYKKNGDDVKSSEPFINSVIPFFQMDSIDEVFAKMLAEEIRSDLKWNTQSDGKRGTLLFLKQIVMMICAHLKFERGAKEVNFHWSYPKSFSEPLLRNYTENWSNILTKVGKETGLTLTSNLVDKDTVKKVKDAYQLDMPMTFPIDESIASAMYCINEVGGFAGTAQGSYAVSVDVGGGSTDVVIWETPIGKNNETKVKASFSVEFAGRDIFDNLVKTDGSFCAWLVDVAQVGDNETSRRDISAKIKKIIEKTPETERGNLVSSIMKMSEEKIWNYFNESYIGGGDRKVNFLRSAIFLFYSGLYYHIGQYFRNDTELQSVKFHIGGNGSKLLNLLSKDQSRYAPFLQKAFALGANNPKLYKENMMKISSEISKMPKSEVCYGSLAKDNQKSSSIVSNAILKIAENKEENKGPKKFLDARTAASPAKNMKESIVGLDGFSVGFEALQIESEINFETANKWTFPTAPKGAGAKFEELRSLVEDLYELNQITENMNIFQPKYDEDKIDRSIKAAYKGTDVLQSPFIVGLKTILNEMCSSNRENL